MGQNLENSAALAKAKRERKDRSKADLALAMLRIHPATGIELLQLCGHRFSTAINQLRKRGFGIVWEEVNDLYTLALEPAVENVKVTPAMKDGYYECDHWKERSDERRQFDRRRCFRCQCLDPGVLQVHHWRYELFAEDLYDLVTVCIPCHRAIHQYENINLHFPHYVSPEIGEKLSLLKDAMPWEPTEQGDLF